MRVIRIRRPSDTAVCTAVWCGVGVVVVVLATGPLADDALSVAPVPSCEGTPSSEGGGSDISESLSKDTSCTPDRVCSAPSEMALAGGGQRSLRWRKSSVERAIAFWRRAVSASADLEYFSFCCAFL